MQNPKDFYDKGRDSLASALEFRAGFSRLSDNEVAELYMSDSIVSKIVDSTSYWLSSYAWDVSSTDAELAALVRDFLNEIDLFQYLGACYKYSMLFEESYLILHPGFFNGTDNLRPLGVYHSHQYKSGIWGNYVYQWEEGEVSSQQLIPIFAEDSIRKIFIHYHRYLEALEQASELAANNSLLIISDESLVRDNSRYRNRQEQIEALENIAKLAKQELNRNGVAALSGNPHIHSIQRNARDALDFVDKARDAFLAGTVLPEHYLFGRSSNGSGLAGIHELVDRQIAKLVQDRRTIAFTKVVNFFIRRFLMAIGEAPNKCEIQWAVREPESAMQRAEIELLRAQKEKIQLASGILSVQEVRAQYLGRSSSQDLVIKSAESPDNKMTLTDSVQTEFIDYIWEQYNELTNMSFEELVAWKNNPESMESPVDLVNLNRNIILKTITKAELERSSELQAWMNRAIKKLKKLANLPPSDAKRLAQKYWGFSVKVSLPKAEKIKPLALEFLPHRDVDSAPGKAE